MSWTVVGSVSQYSGAGGTSVASPSITVAAGDVVVVNASNQSGNTMTVADDLANALTAAPHGAELSSTLREQTFYQLSAPTAGSRTYTITFGASSSSRSVRVTVLRPSGGTASLDTDGGNNGLDSTTTISSGNITTSADSGASAVVAGACAQGATFSAQAVNGVAADDVETDPGPICCQWTSIGQGTFTGAATTTLTAGGPNRWLITVVAFKITVSARRFLLSRF